MKLAAAFFLFPILCWAHGEDKPGPHGGHIKMPGAFHVELVPDQDQSIHAYLLDMDFKNPIVKDSEISIVAREKKNTVKFKCSVMGGSHYHCIPEKKYPQKGELLVKATRAKAAGNEVSYSLPFKELPAEKAPEKPSGHQHH